MNQQGINQHYVKNVISVQDLIQYKEKQKIWEKLGSMGKTEINTQITIETNVFQNLTVQVKAYLTKPIITGEEEIDFGLVQIGTS